MTAVQVRVIDTNQFSVRDTSFCSPTATTAVNVLGLVRLPDNITSVPPYQDTLKIFRDAAGTSLYAQRINSWTVAWNISCHYGDTTVYLQLCSGAIKSAVLPIHITINPMPVGPTPNYYLWRPGGEHPSEMSADELRDWNDLRNWAADDGSEPIELPSSISAVYIAGTDWTAGTPLEYFPDLTNINDAICQDIFFAHGAELTRPDKLDYQRAYVSLNFGLKNSSQKKNIVAQDTLATLAFLAADALTRNQWHLLTAPLGDMVTGDYAFGGYPATYLRKFSASATTSGSALVGNWSNYFTSNNETLRAGEGFVLHVNDYRDQTLFREYGSGVDTPVSAQSREYGLKQANGLLVFPYFDHKNWSDAHRIHTYDADQKTSRFYGIHDKQVDLPLLNSYATKERTEKANRFVFESTADHPNVSYSVTAGDVVWADDIHHFAMVGNPYLSSIDFDQFHEDNKEIIKNGFYLFVGDKYETYSPEGSDLNKFIAPMQSFLVEMQDAVSTGDLKFNVANISVPRDEATTLRSSRPTHNRMKVTLSNLYGESNTYLATRDYGMPTADRHDLTKLLSGIKASPEVYTLKNIKQSATRKAALANQVLPNGQTLVPLGIATSHEGKMRFDFSGMDSYNADIRFIDNGLQKEIDISGKDAFDYEFAYTPSVDNQGKVLADENRFFLRISGIIDGIDDVSKYEIIIYDTPNNIGVMASNDNPIRNLIITDAQGRILYCDDKVDAAFAQVRKTNELPSVFLVKVVTEYSTKTQKLITK